MSTIVTNAASTTNAIRRVSNTIIEHGHDGFLARTDADWVTALDTLASDPGLRRRMGVAARQKVVGTYSLAAQQPAVLGALRKAITEQ